MLWHGAHGATCTCSASSCHHRREECLQLLLPPVKAVMCMLLIGKSRELKGEAVGEKYV